MNGHVFTIRNRRNLDAAHSAAELAWRLACLCHWGIELRRSDRCAGGVRPSELLLSPDRVMLKISPSRSHRHTAARRAETHGRSGHDTGCGAVGLPVHLIRQMLVRWDTVGAHRYLMEAVEECLSDITHHTELAGGEWNEQYAVEAATFALQRRITPLPARPRS